jgi:hypothetical protein
MLAPAVRALHRSGPPIARRGDRFGYGFSNALGWSSIAPTDIVALNLLGSATSAAWARARHRRGARGGR